MQKLSELEDANASQNNKRHDKNAKCNEPLIVNSCQPGKNTQQEAKAKQSKNDATACHAAQKRQRETKMTRTRVR
jgi:hypothetical protein